MLLHVVWLNRAKTVQQTIVCRVGVDVCLAVSLLNRIKAPPPGLRPSLASMLSSLELTFMLNPFAPLSSAKMLLSLPADLTRPGLLSTVESMDACWPALLQMLQAEDSTLSPSLSWPVRGGLWYWLSCLAGMRWPSVSPGSNPPCPVVKICPRPGPELAKAPDTSAGLSCCWPLWILEFSGLAWLSSSVNMSFVAGNLSNDRPPILHESDSDCSGELFSSLREKERDKCFCATASYRKSKASLSVHLISVPLIHITCSSSII